MEIFFREIILTKIKQEEITKYMYFKFKEKYLFKRWLFIKRDVFVVSLGDFFKYFIINTL